MGVTSNVGSVVRLGNTVRLSDPTLAALATLQAQVATLQAQVATLQAQMTGHTHQSGTVENAGGTTILP